MVWIKINLKCSCLYMWRSLVLYSTATNIKNGNVAAGSLRLALQKPLVTFPYSTPWKW